MYIHHCYVSILFIRCAFKMFYIALKNALKIASELENGVTKVTKVTKCTHFGFLWNHPIFYIPGGGSQVFDDLWIMVIVIFIAHSCLVMHSSAHVSNSQTSQRPAIIISAVYIATHTCQTFGHSNTHLSKFCT